MSFEKIKCSLQYLLPHHFLSRLIAKLANCKLKIVKNSLIKLFIKGYQIDLNIAASQDLNDYPTFNSFFTRALNPSKRPIATESNSIMSPADGLISQFGMIKNGQLLQAKNHLFEVGELIGDILAAKHYRQGQFMTIYLSPQDYHRVHMPLAGQLLKTIYIPGALFSVNCQSVQNIPNLFARNERLVCFFNTAVGEVVLILVGAMLVAGIETVWDKKPSAKEVLVKEWHNQAIYLDKGAEMGRFQFGSTVIMLFGENKIQFLSQLGAARAIKMGETIASTIPEGLNEYGS